MFRVLVISIALSAMSTAAFAAEYSCENITDFFWKTQSPHSIVWGLYGICHFGVTGDFTTQGENLTALVKLNLLDSSRTGCVPSMQFSLHGTCTGSTFDLRDDIVHFVGGFGPGDKVVMSGGVPVYGDKPTDGLINIVMFADHP